MRQAFAHEVVLVLEPGADPAAPGAAVAVALCGHWDHEPPCPLSPHRVDVEQGDSGLRVRIVFAADPEAEPEVRRRIELALAGRWEFPAGFGTPWQVRESRSREVAPDEREVAERLISRA